MKALLLTASGLAVAAFLGPAISIFAFNNFFQFLIWMIGDICIAFICFVLLVVGLTQFRLRGLWLAMPLAVTCVWPLFLEVGVHLHPQSF